MAVSGSIHPRNSFALNAFPSRPLDVESDESSGNTTRRQSVVQISARLVSEDDDAVEHHLQKPIALKKQPGNDLDIYRIDAATLPTILASNTNSDDDDSSTCKKCSLKRKQFGRNRIHKGDVTFAYRTRPKWDVDLHRTMSDQYQSEVRSSANVVEAAIPRSRKRTLKKRIKPEDDAELSDSERNIVEAVNSVVHGYTNASIDP